ncbi:MAG: Rieske 2Fe-2S domain-containing protein [Chloroflexi bacterium]|nr:Rieske 2Fe-2S domain-containing protein [Chloroflexota bacterium]
MEPEPAAEAVEVAPDPATPSRRKFLRWLGGLALVSTAAMILTPVVGFLIPTKNRASGGGGKVLVATTADIPAGAGEVVAMGSKPAIVVNTDQGVKAYSAICTHLGCVVAWNDMIGAIQCPCHDGRFNAANGAVVSGPPPAPLPPLTVTVEGDQIFLSEA